MYATKHSHAKHAVAVWVRVEVEVGNSVNLFDNFKEYSRIYEY